MKSTNTFGIQFITRLCKGEANHLLLFARITVNGKRLEISLKTKIEKDKWDSNKSRMKGNTANIKGLNKYIESVRYQLTECYHELQRQGKVITAQELKSFFLSEDKQDKTLCGLMSFHNNNMKGTLRPGTLKNYFTTAKYIQKFLKDQMNTSDIPVCNLNYQFITEFESYLRICRPLDKNNRLTNNGIMKHLERLKKLAALAYKLEWISKHPFQHFQLRFDRKEMSFLTKTELQKIEVTEFSKPHLERIRDLFVFSCYTGLSYADVAGLTCNNVTVGIDGEKWIKTVRSKTNIQVNVPLLPRAADILEKYKNQHDDPKNENILPVVANQKVNFYLKEIAKLAGVRKYLTFHMARHTFSTTVTLANGVPIETVSRMLGHTKLTTTQIYVHVLEKKISTDMKELKFKITK